MSELAFRARPWRPWFHRYRPRPTTVARLVCFPHAGGGASYFRRWVDLTPAGVEVVAAQYPGHEDRFAEPPATDLAGLAQRYAEVLCHVGDDLPLVLLGHSLGAAVAYETARRLEAVGRSPALLVVSGRQAAEDPSRAVHLMSDDEVWADIAAAGGTHPEILASTEVRDAILPIVRADYRLSETYRREDGPLLQCPVLACSGNRDPDVDLNVLPGWGALTEGRFETAVLPGDHFFLTWQWHAVVDLVVRRLAEQMTGVPLWPSMP